MKKLLLSLLLVLNTTILIKAQQSGQERLLEMKNLFNLGLNVKAYEVAAELMSWEQYSSVREETMFFIAELNYINHLFNSKDNEDFINVAFTYYKTMMIEYPSSKFNETIQGRLKDIESNYSLRKLLRNYFDTYQNEAAIVENKLNFIEASFTVRHPNPYRFFTDNTFEKNTIKSVDAYYDDIIVNHPDFDLYAYYYKILLLLSRFEGADYFSDGYFKFQTSKIPLLDSRKISNKLPDDISYIKTTVNKYLELLDKKYPNHPITLELHLIVASYFINIENDEIDSETKEHLEFVIQNEKNQNHPRYILTKQFLLNNKFK